MEDRSQPLWDAWRRGRDGSAFAALVEPELGRALGFARALGCGAEEAEDAVQEALARLASERGEEPSRVGVRAWFYRAVRDRARTEARSRRRRRERERAAARPEAEPLGPDRPAIREQVEQALLGLDADDREAVRLRFLQDLDYREMGVVLGVSEGACRVRVHRALETLKLRLGAGAAALVAALPLPVPANAGMLVQGALAMASGTGTAAAAAAGGAIVASTGKMAFGAAVLLALGVVGVVAFGTLGSDDAPAPAGGAVADAGRKSTAGGAPAPSAPPAKPLANPGAKLVERPGAAPADSPGAGTPAVPSPSPSPSPGAPAARAGPTLEVGAAEPGIALVDRFRTAPADPGEFLWNYGRVRAAVRTGEGETRRIDATGEVTPVDLEDLAEKSAVIEFGPGRFQFPRATGGKGQFHTPRKEIRSLEIRGAGKDATILDGKGAWAFLCTQEGIENLHLHDFTYDGGPERAAFLDVRGSGSVVVENVRFRNIPTRGNAAALATSGRLYLAAKNCEFLGDGLEWGSALGIRGSALALLEECRFVHLPAAVMAGGGEGDASAVNLLDCVFDGSPVVDRGPGKRADGTWTAAVRVQGGRVQMGPAGASAEKVLEAWGIGSIVEAKGVSAGPGTAMITIKDLLAALDRLSLPAEQFVTGIRAHPGDSDRPAGWIAAAVGTGAAAGKEFHYYLPAGSGGPEELPRKIRAIEVPKAEDLEGALPLARLLRESGLPPESGVSGIEIQRRVGAGDASFPMAYLRAPRGWPQGGINGKTGEKLWR